MDQGAFLSRAFWQYFEASTFTDLVLNCDDGEVSVHSPILASVLSKIGFSSSSEERQGSLVLPGLRYFTFQQNL